jgi:hypothetical protein
VVVVGIDGSRESAALYVEVRSSIRCPSGSA